MNNISTTTHVLKMLSYEVDREPSETKKLFVLCIENLSLLYEYRSHFIIIFNDNNFMKWDHLVLKDLT